MQDKIKLMNHKELVELTLKAAKATVEDNEAGDPSIIRVSIESGGIMCVCVLAVRRTSDNGNTVSDI